MYIDQCGRESSRLNRQFGVSAPSSAYLCSFTLGKTLTLSVTELESIAVKKHVESNTLAAPHSNMGPNVRYPAAGEMGYLSRLVSKHGEDVEGMARDLKLNPDQRTAGQLRRALRNAGFPCGK